MTVASSRTKGVTSCSLTASATVTGSVSRSQIVAAASVAASRPTTPATLMPIRARLMVSRCFSYYPDTLDGVTPAQVYVYARFPRAWPGGRLDTQSANLFLVGFLHPQDDLPELRLIFQPPLGFGGRLERVSAVDDWRERAVEK